jgi:WS/DGAT/MGAT family acyltransferase
MVVRIHHCLTDGVSGVGILNVLLDASPVPARSRKRLRVRPPAEPANASVLGGILNSCFTVSRRALLGSSELLAMGRELLAAIAKTESAPAPIQPQAKGNPNLPPPSAEAVLQRVPEIAQAAERLPFNVVCHGPQRLAWTQIPLDEIKAVKQTCGATVNDVILTVVTLAVRRYVERHGVPLQGRLLRLVIPVNVRGEGDVSELGNRITFLPLALPLDVGDPRALLAVVRERMLFSRGVHLPELVGIFGTFLGIIPTALQAVIGPLISQLPISLCNMICTNVPGPQQLLYLCGHKLLSLYPYVPIGGEMGMNCAVMTYNGTAFFGFSGDAHAIPDLERLEKFVNDGFKKLRQAAGVPAARTRRSPPAPRPKRSPARVPSPPSKPPASRAASQVGPASAAPEPPAKPKAEPEREPNALSTAAGA